MGMTALSVSTSAISSPALILSPSFLCHLTRVPSLIVSDSCGIVISAGMGGVSVARGHRGRGMIGQIAPLRDNARSQRPAMPRLARQARIGGFVLRFRRALNKVEHS